VHDFGGEAVCLHECIQRPQIIAPTLLNLDVAAVHLLKRTVGLAHDGRLAGVTAHLAAIL
jgi:hypothetical protein